MKAIERNLSRHSNGTLYFVARRGGKLRLRSLRTKNLAVARRRLLQLGEEAVIEGKVRDLTKRRSSSQNYPGSYLGSYPGFPGGIPGERGFSSNGVTNYQVGEKFFKQCLEQFDRTLRPVLLSRGALAMAARGRQAVESYASDWETFSPIGVWQGYRDSGLLRFGRQLTSGANHVKWYLGRLSAWAAEMGYIPQARVAEVFGQLKQVPRIKIPPRRIRIPELSQVEEYFHRLALSLGLSQASSVKARDFQDRSRDKSEGKLGSFRQTENGQLALDFVKFLAYTGLRRSSALSLTWRAVDFDSRSMEVIQKGGHRVVIPLTSQALEVLENRYRFRAISAEVSDLSSLSSGPFVALASDGPKISRHLYALSRRMKRVSKELGVDFETFHSFRHYFASRALMSGLSVAEVATLLGHRDGGVLVLQTYGHICGHRLRQVVGGLRC